MNTSARDRNERSPGADKFQVSKEMKSGGLLVSLERKSHFLPAGASGSHGTPNHEEWERKQNLKKKRCDALFSTILFSIFFSSSFLFLNMMLQDNEAVGSEEGRGKGVGVGVGVGRERALRDFRVLKQLSRALEPLLADCPQLYGMAFHEGEREEREEREEEEELDEFLHREGGIVGGAEGEGWEEACGLLRKELRALERLACRAQEKSLRPGRLGGGG